MGDGIFGGTEATVKAQAGIAAEAQLVRTDIDILIGDVLIVENKAWPELEVADFGYSIANRTRVTTKYWPRRMIAWDLLPDAGDNTPIGNGETRSTFWQKAVHSRGLKLARRGVIYVWSHAGGAPVDAVQLAEAEAFMLAHRDDPAGPEPVKSETYIRASTAMLGTFDEQTGIGVVRKIE